jgi:serine/threonine-protein kinase RsbW/stage II sporulation protein AB (anti-sigma F factor)
VRLQLKSEPRSIKRARDAVSAFAERVGASARDVKLAVSEAVTNAVVHAFRGRAAGTISVEARMSSGLLLVVVADDGIGMVPNPDSAGLGMGLSLITQLAHDVRFDSGGEGVTVSMRFEVAA